MYKKDGFPRWGAIFFLSNVKRPKSLRALGDIGPRPSKLPLIFNFQFSILHSSCIFVAH